MVTITKSNDEYFIVVDDQEPVQLEVKQPKGWDETLFLPENPTHRKLINKAAADKRLEANGGSFELTVKAERAAGTGNGGGSTIPNKALVEYLKTLENGQELYDEYIAIIERAKAARDEAKKKPLTEKEKLLARIERAKKALAELEEEQATGEDIVDGGENNG